MPKYQPRSFETSLTGSGRPDKAMVTHETPSLTGGENKAHAMGRLMEDWCQASHVRDREHGVE